jgi:hypothetical protein
LKLFIACFTFLCILIHPLASTPKKLFKYIYIDANAGQSSGGHSAILLEDFVYHFQYYPDSIFHLVREPFSSFQKMYGVIGNRSIFIHEIELDEKDYEKFRFAWNRFYFQQSKEILDLQNKENDLILLDALYLDGQLSLKGAGYFKKNTSSTLPKFQLKNSQLQIQKTFWENTLKNMSSPDQLNKESISVYYLNALYYQMVWEIISGKYEFSQEGVFEWEEIEKNPTQKKELLVKMKSLSNLWKKQIQDKIQNPDQYSGYSLLILLARWYVVEKSLSEDKIYFLDSFSDNHSYLPFENLKKEKYSSRVKNQFATLFSEQVVDFLKGEVSNPSYAFLEDRANRFHEFERALLEKRDLRTTFELLLPSRKGFVPLENTLTWDSYQTKRFRSQESFARKQNELQKKYPFDLFRINCTTELFRYFYEITEQDPETSKQFYGGWVPIENSLHFIPFMAYHSVGKEFRVIASPKILSYRKQKLRDLKNKNDWKALLLESNTLTSSLYEFNEEDTLFLFFTDDTILGRPIAGVFNLSFGLIETLLGVGKLPFDEGKTLGKGIQGIFFSVPELFFFNIRKGTFVEEEWDLQKNPSRE